MKKLIIFSFVLQQNILLPNQHQPLPLPPRAEVQEMGWLLQQDGELQEALGDALMRSEQHRSNYTR